MATPRRAPTRARSIAVRPAFVSQHTAPAVLGFKNPRAYLEWLATSGIRVIVRGKDRLVLLDDAEAALVGVVDVASNEKERTQPGPQLTSVDAVLHELGRRRIGARR